MAEIEQVDDEPITLPIEGPNFFKIGFWLTLSYLTLVIGFSLWDWIDVALMKPNEWGDFLAGIFGPLALLWVVLGFLQQGSELKNSRDALLLQAQELRHSVEAQKDLGQAAWAQVGEERLTRENAAIERQKEEEVLRQAELPTLVVHNGGGGSGSGEKYIGLSIHNQGKTCIKISCSIDDSNLRLNRMGFHQLNQSQSENLKITTDLNYEFCDCVLRLSFQDLKGGNHSQLFQLKAANRSLLIVDSLGVEGTDC